MLLSELKILKEEPNSLDDIGLNLYNITTDNPDNPGKHFRKNDKAFADLNDFRDSFGDSMDTIEKHQEADNLWILELVGFHPDDDGEQWVVLGAQIEPWNPRHGQDEFYQVVHYNPEKVERHISLIDMKKAFVKMEAEINRRGFAHRYVIRWCE